MRHISIRNRLLFVLGVILIFSFTGVSYVNYVVTRASVRNEILRTDLPLTMDNIYSELTAELTRPLLVSTSMASDTFLKDWVLGGEKDKDKILRYLEKLREKYDFFTTFFISAATSTYYRYNGVHKKVSRQDSHDVWFYNFAASNEEYDFDVDTDEAANNVLTIFINCRVESAEGEFLGVTGVGLQVNKVAKMVAQYKEQFDRRVYLSNQKGIIQIHPDTSLIEKKRVDELEGMSAISFEGFSKNSTPMNFDFDRENQRILLTVKYIEPLDWYLYVEQNETASLETARKNFKRTVTFGLVASVIVIAFTLVTINRYQERIEVLATVDELTRVSNRRAFETGYKTFQYNHTRTGNPFCVILIDLDNFKKVNDKFGHIVGDKFLIQIAGLMSSLVRPSDVFARWGGDEFAILTESSADEAMQMANRIINSVREKDFAGNGVGSQDPRNLVTISCGVSLFKEGNELDTLLRRADKAMYDCKNQGGDGCQLAG